MIYLQILCLAEQIRFTDNCEKAIANGSLSSFNKDLESQLESYTSVDMSESSGQTAGHVLELKLKALILDTIHAIDVVHQLIGAGTRSTGDWMWQKQLRFVMTEINLDCF